ncbi:MAG: hypothetical protein WA614_04325 [Acidimicrobiales bacterium]|jgi:hypothetical protein
MNAALESLTLAVQATSVHRGAVLPEGRIVVIVVPLAALAFYFFVVRRHRDR